MGLIVSILGPLLRWLVEGLVVGAGENRRRAQDIVEQPESAESRDRAARFFGGERV